MTAHMLSARIYSDRGFPVHRDAVCLEASAECVAYSAQMLQFHSPDRATACDRQCLLGMQHASKIIVISV